MPRKKFTGGLGAADSELREHNERLPYALLKTKPLPRQGQFQPKTFSGPNLEAAAGKAGLATPSSLLPKRQRARVR